MASKRKNSVTGLDEEGEARELDGFFPPDDDEDTASPDDGEESGSDDDVTDVIKGMRLTLSPACNAIVNRVSKNTGLPKADVISVAIIGMQSLPYEELRSILHEFIMQKAGDFHDALRS